MALTKHIQIMQGSRFSLRWRLRDQNGTYFNLGGWTWRGNIRRTAGSTTIVQPFAFLVSDYTDTDNITHVGAIVEAFLLPSGTAAIPTGTYVYDIEFDPPEGTNYTDKLWVGQADVAPEVTR